MLSRPLLLMAALLLVLAACEAPSDDDDSADDDDVADDDDSTEEAVCVPEDLTPLPVDFEELGGVLTGEDFAFGADGSVLSVDLSGNVIRNPPEGGEPEIISPNLSSGTAGVALLPGGDLVIADTARGGLQRVDVETGGSELILSGLEYPNGVAVHRDGWVAVSEEAGQRVRRVDPVTGEFVVLGTELPGANGVTFSPDWNTLYVGSFGEGTVHAIPLDAEGAAGPAELFGRTTGPGSPFGSNHNGIDGIGTDICGNVYVSIWMVEVGSVLRFTESGATPENVANLPGGWIPNMEFGNGQGRWDRHHLYVSSYFSEVMYALDIGVPGRPMAAAD